MGAVSAGRCLGEVGEREVARATPSPSFFRLLQINRRPGSPALCPPADPRAGRPGRVPHRRRTKWPCTSDPVTAPACLQKKRKSEERAPRLPSRNGRPAPGLAGGGGRRGRPPRRWRRVRDSPGALIGGTKGGAVPEEGGGCGRGVHPASGGPVLRRAGRRETRPLPTLLCARRPHPLPCRTSAPDSAMGVGRGSVFAPSPAIGTAFGQRTRVRAPGRGGGHCRG